MTKKELENYLSFNLGKSKSTFQGLKYCCPKCDKGQKYNLEINLNESSLKPFTFKCWSCQYSGHIKKLLKDYAISNDWSSYFKTEAKSIVHKELTIKNIELPLCSSYHLNEEVKNYLEKERRISNFFLKERRVYYCYSKEEKLYGSIIFPFFNEKNELISYSTLNLKTKKYKNHTTINFIPYNNFIDKRLPIFLTEGVFDALSLPVNGLPILGTMIPLEILRFVYNKNIVLCFDNDYQSNLKEEMIKKLFLYGCKSISEFKIPSEYKDLNDFKIKDEKGLLSIFKEIINQINA